jgi:hypothetical protein
LIEKLKAMPLTQKQIKTILTSLTAPVDGITLNELGDFVDWINKTNFKQYPAGWCQAGGSNGWHCTTQELINFFKIRTKSTNP